MKDITNTSAGAQSAVLEAKDLPKLTHAEATRLATAEHQRFLALLDTLSEADWQRPTVCTLWDVRRMVAHLAGTAAGYTSWGEFKRQFVINPYAKQTKLKVDAISMCQVEDRADASPEELMTELRERGPKAIRTRSKLPALLRSTPAPFGPPLGVVPIGYLTDLIYTRDMWMHRLDISRATGREMALDATHDGRVVQLVLRDLGKKLARLSGGSDIRLELTGPAGGTFHFGAASDSATVIQMDALDFNWLAASRTTPEAIRPEVRSTGDDAVVDWFLEHAGVPF